MKRREILSAALFVAILAGFVWALSLYFLPKDNTAEAGIQDVRPNGFLSEPENSLDYVIFGDSIPLVGISPLEIWKNWGYTGYDCVDTGQNAEMSAILLGHVLERQTPKVVFMETNHLYKGYSAEDILTLRLERAVPVLQYHDNWKFLKPAQALRPVNYTLDVQGKGFYLRKLIVGTDPGDYMAPSDYNDPLPEQSCRSLERIAELCREKGVQLVLVSVPSPVNWNDACHRAVAGVADSLNVPYLDLNLVDIGIDWSQDTMDAGDHLNITGTVKVCAYLGEYLADTGLMKDKRLDPAFDGWNRDVADFEAAAATVEDAL